MLLNLASLALSTASSTRPGLSLMGASWREFGLIPQAAALLFAWTVAAAWGSARVILRGAAVAGLAAGAYGIAQYFGWDPLLPASAYHVGEGIWTIVRPPGTMGYVSYFATWLLMCAFLGLWLGAADDHPAWRRAGYFAAALCFVAMALPGTRAALAALAAGKHTLVEKPMALDGAGGDQLTAAACASGRVLMTAQVVRFAPNYHAAA